MSFSKRFDENGNRLRSVCVTHQIHDDVVVNLDSKHPGISDATLNTALQMVHDDRVSDFHSFLEQISEFKIE
jgi:hypothetical protein